jgi:hypothetical protein
MKVRYRMQKVLIVLMLPFYLLLFSPLVMAQQQKGGNDSIEVMNMFNKKELEKKKERGLTDDDKHRILFFMGISLLVLLCSTAYFGVSMVVFNKQLFVPHMISAGLTVTLGLAHAVAAIVWFFPY